ncbi:MULTISPECIES: helix-turn-helix domain-containing protein [Burkholderia cepacia complex]|uniref:helix-turn-helix domain-containing protein n=1 Tax=Burkholderia cepacia complex TaxID=87882 RepID=UPI0003C4BD98|nr:AraC family transcriptional regulator [Burkholderia cenocepacia]ESS39224.1 Transcriptional regulator, AraC family [Burkholderia cenocepacia KC-01]ELK7719469.1 helix-turn-helix transcriptional regulator [Burkholderia cenocepacia]MBR8304897.1 helix-turn-helix transcriptional regulator [Burkholderia cenocepacia]MCA7964079.1 AraC family transcriptional regulator [Burkholderia cenocepacia]MCF1365801.1 AraC family transcriptional regulator [Burkholderia cenocepacia]
MSLSLCAPPVDRAAALAGGDLPFGLQSVCRTLADANATLERFAWLGDHLAIAEWTRITDESETVYEQPGHHTLSCYLDGGYRTERQRVPRYGAPSLLCALPGDHESRWWVRGEMHFIHLYFLPEHFTQRAIRELDREPRELKLADRTYFEDARVAALLRSLALDGWDDADQRLRVNETAHEVLSLLLRGQSTTRTDTSFRGGLAPAVRRRVRDYIDTYLTQPLTLGELAEVAALSEYHFSRMFRLSFGRAPHAWVAEQRLARARELLRTTSLPLAQIAADCGYANAGHFSHRFRDAHGTTPNTYRRAMQGR